MESGRLTEYMKAPLLGETEYKDDPLADELHPYDSDPPLGTIECAAAQAEAQQQRRRRIRKRRRIFFHVLAFNLFVIFLVVRHGKKIAGASRDFLDGMMGSDLKKFEGDGDGRWKLPVPPGMSLGRCTKWDGKDVDDDEEEVLGLNSGMTYEVGEDGVHWINRPIEVKKQPKPVEGDVSIQIVNPQSTNLPITSSAEFNVSLSSSMLFISRGSLAAGSVKVVQSADRVGQEARTTVVVTTNEERHGFGHDGFLDLVRVCKVKKDDGETDGVGIFTPVWEGHHRRPGRGCGGRHKRPKFDVTIELPRFRYEGAPDTEQTHVMHLETDMPLFKQDVETEVDKVLFRDFFARGSLLPIVAVNLEAQNLKIVTENAAITGNYSTWGEGSIVLKTVNAPIDVTLQLSNDGEGEAVSAILSTKNAPVISKNSLISSSDDKIGGKFNLTVSTVNSPIKLSFPTAPINSTLTLDADTALGSIEADMHPTFEGYFFMKTVLMDVNSVMDENEQDPEGKGRKRGILSSVMRGYDKGQTMWRAENGGFGPEDWWGNVTLKSSLAPITMYYRGGGAA